MIAHQPFGDGVHLISVTFLEGTTGWKKANSRMPALPEPTIRATELSLRTFFALVEVGSIIAISRIKRTCGSSEGQFDSKFSCTFFDEDHLWLSAKFTGYGRR
jgi:hypothetical protein